MAPQDNAMPIVSLKWIFIALGLVYFVWPMDAIPDVAGLVGRIDDLLVVGYLVYRWKKILSRDRDAAEPKIDQATRTQSAAIKRTPYEILGVSERATSDEVRKAYATLAAQYHPDKVNHLGAELRALAHEKMLEIQSAYDTLNSSRP